MTTGQDTSMTNLSHANAITTARGEVLTAITTGSVEVDKKLGGGIPVGSLTLIEGQSGAGKSVLTQQLTKGALESGCMVAYYTTENTVKSLLSQTASLGMELTDYFLMDRLRIVPIPLVTGDSKPNLLAQILVDEIKRLPEGFSCVMVDSITSGRDR